MKLFELLDSPVQLIMYDLDGTLVDSAPDLATALDKMLIELNLPEAGNEKARLWVGNGIPSLVKRALADDMMGDQPGVVEEGIFAKALERFKHHYAIEVGQHSALYPGVFTFLSQIHKAGIRQAVVTNKSEIFTNPLLKRMGIDHFFELSVGGDSLNEQKPHPLPLQHTMKHFDCNTQNSLMIGDSSNDVKAARAADVKVVGLPYGYNHGEPIESAHPDLVIDSLTDLL
ncbi:phosphoglycolate phosphatase [Endozoicomonas sp. 8E]|uniref:phosphoglycolate phosphatase n=1 Tax=Endozoicomonas sp. 8E TaxID=3035692 RepID=UPI0029394063|nr:phosphoglycolate phosphatase [Endozoicomonas sp. 8E]WOG26374.1 phosphoglycolate phosphatase [Endozoicomonas sp. 8E]